MGNANVNHEKLIYELSRVMSSYASGSVGLIYYKVFYTPISERHFIWAKRAYKKGYLYIVEENSEYVMYNMTDEGIALITKLKPELTTVTYTKSHSEGLTAKEKRKLRRQKRMERRLQNESV